MALAAAAAVSSSSSALEVRVLKNTALSPRVCGWVAETPYNDGRSPPVHQCLLLIPIDPHQAVEEVAALQQRLDTHVLVEPVHVAKVRAEKQRVDTVGWDAHRVEELAIGGTGLQDRQHRHAGPELRRELLHRAKDLRGKWGGRAGGT